MSEDAQAGQFQVLQLRSLKELAGRKRDEDFVNIVLLQKQWLAIHSPNLICPAALWVERIEGGRE